jgi:hypothetical protein
VIEQALAVAVEVAQGRGLNSIGKDAKQKMAGQSRGRSSSEHSVPAGSKFSEIEIAQTRDLDLNRLSA